MKGKTLFRLGQNCSAVATAAHARPLVDCADFFRAIHDSISKARRSVFILGWEIDSGTRLLRGDDERNAVAPSAAVDFLGWVARRRPGLRIYLLRWDSSVMFINDREIAPELTWTVNTPENLHLCLDDTAPMGGSQHQKIILVDDELVFTGGMDIARQRWDERAHRVDEPGRTDALGPYGPYHDVQIVMDGPIVTEFSELVRWRWRRAAGYDAIPAARAPRLSHGSPAPTWPSAFPPLIRGIPCAVALTIPPDDEQNGVRDVFRMYVDLIAAAEDFIYIENQFFTSVDVAIALNRRLKEKPRLRALLLSSHEPAGIMEREGMWAGRIDFRRALEEGLGPDRVRIVSAARAGPDGPVHKKIHSKVVVVDDRYLAVASSNISRRSMTIDTECDVVLAARDAAHSEKIAFFRNDLIAEHSGRTVAEVAAIFESGFTFEKLFAGGRPDDYGLRGIDDSRITDQNLKTVALSLADPEEPFMTAGKPLRNPSRFVFLCAIPLALIAIAAFFLIRHWTDGFDPREIERLLRAARGLPWSLPVVVGIFVVGGFVLFPVTVMSLLTAAVFGAVRGPVYAMCGALASAAVMFALGHFAGLKGLRRLMGERARRIDHQFRDAGVVGVAIIRMIPIAPYSVVNLAAGISSVRFTDFLLGTFLGFLPAFIVKGLVGDSMIRILLEPTPRSIAILALAVAAWIALTVASSILVKTWRRRREA